MQVSLFETSAGEYRLTVKGNKTGAMFCNPFFCLMQSSTPPISSGPHLSVERANSMYMTLL